MSKSSKFRVQSLKFKRINCFWILYIGIWDLIFILAIFLNSNISYAQGVGVKPITEIPVGAKPTGIALSPTGKRAYVSNAAENSISVIDLSLNREVDRIPNVGPAPAGIALIQTPSEELLFVTSQTSNSISIVNPSNRDITKIDLPQEVRTTSVEILKVGERLLALVTNVNSNHILIVDIESMALIGFIETGSNPVFIILGGNLAFVSNRTSNILSIINTSNNQVQATVTVGGEPIGIAVHPSGNPVYVANSRTDNISIVDVFTGKLTGNIPLRSGDAPTDIDISPDGKVAFVSNFLSDSLSIIDLTLNKVMDTIPVGGNRGPIQIALNPEGRRLLVTNSRSNSVGIWEIVAVTLGPKVVSIEPAKGATNVPLSSPITINFSKPVRNVNNRTFTVTFDRPGLIGGILSLSSDGTKATFFPLALLPPNLTLTISLSPEIVDAEGKPLLGDEGKPFSSTFTTRSLP